MEVFFKPSFLRDFRKLPADIKRSTKHLCAGEFPKCASLGELNAWDIKKLWGYQNYYRVRIGDYRVGFKVEKNAATFMRVRHRRDIYRVFP